MHPWCLLVVQEEHLYSLLRGLACLGEALEVCLDFPPPLWVYQFHLPNSYHLQVALCFSKCLLVPFLGAQKHSKRHLQKLVFYVIDHLYVYTARVCNTSVVLLLAVLAVVAFAWA
jgi:hypothetical protein